LFFKLHFVAIYFQPSFASMERALSKTIVMALGEMDFTSTFVDSIDSYDKSTGYPLNPFPEFGFLFCAIFVYTISITLMNLLVSEDVHGFTLI